MNFRPKYPILSCRNKTGPSETVRINTEIKTASGRTNGIINRTKTTSRVRFQCGRGGRGNLCDPIMRNGNFVLRRTRRAGRREAGTSKGRYPSRLLGKCVPCFGDALFSKTRFVQLLFDCKHRKNSSAFVRFVAFTTNPTSYLPNTRLGFEFSHFQTKPAPALCLVPLKSVPIRPTCS